MAAAAGTNGKKKRRTSQAPTGHRAQPAPHPTTTTSPDDEPILMPVRTMVKGRWRIERQLAKGAFGQISVARDLKTDRMVAVKAEAIDAQMTFLRMEVAILRALQTKTCQVPRFIACGHTPEVNYLIMQLLGPSLLELKKKTIDDRFSIGTAIRVADSMLSALQCLHECGWVHRDVKPSNFVIGPVKEDLRMVYMLDFGLCRQYIDPVDGKQRPPRMRCGFRGTVRYACIDTLKSLDVGRDGDFHSLYYVLVEMINGQLPWRRVLDKRLSLEMKERMPLTQLLQGEPAELCEMAEHIDSLDFYACPDYDRMRRVLAKILDRFNVTDESPMDWELMRLDDLALEEKVESEKSEAECGGASGRGANVVDG